MAARPEHLPDFIIGGAPRSGTTWLYMALARHPVVYMAEPMRPEPKFFLVDDVYEKGLGEYSKRWFADVPLGAIAGEKSSNYLESPESAHRIAAALPGVKLIFMLREPAERAKSNYLWTVMNGLESETFERALEIEASREASYPPEHRYARPHSYFSRGLYAEHLTRYLEHFDPSQLLILRFEDVVADPQAIVTRVHEFLGVDPRPSDVDGLGQINRSDPLAVHAGEMAALRERYTLPNQRLAELLGEDTVWETR